MRKRSLPFLVLASVLALMPELVSVPVYAGEFWCEGVDEDGNGEIDEGCERTCVDPYIGDSPVTVAPASAGATFVSIARAGTGFGWAYADARTPTSQVYVQVTATSGAPDKPERRISDGTHAATAPVIVWRGASGYGAAWVDQRDGNSEIYFRLLDASGVPVTTAPDVNVSGNGTSSLNPAIVWTGTQFGLVWDDTKGSNRDVYFRRIDQSGAPNGQDVRVTSNTALQEQPSITWDGTQFGIAWTDERDGNREIYARRVDASGGLIGSEVRLTNASGTSERAVIQSLKSADFGVAWQDARSGSDAVWYARWVGPGYASPAGIAVSSGGPARKPSLSTTGAENIVSWLDARNGPNDVYARRIATHGSVLSPEVRVTTGSAATAAAIAWHGSGSGVAYVGDDLGAIRPRLALLSCGGTDPDADGATLAQGECNDANATQKPGAPELCDALDNNCDGTWDESCRGTCAANLPTPAVDAFVSPIAGGLAKVVWNGSGYGIAWQERETYPGCCLSWGAYFRRLDANGVPVSPAVRVPLASLSGENVSLIWTGTEYAVAYEQYDRVTFVARIAVQRIDAAGNPIGTPREVTRDPILGSAGHRRPVVTWRNDQFGLLFIDIRGDGSPRANMFLRLDREGRPLERPRDVSPAPFSELGQIAPDATGYGLAYLYLVDPWFQRLDRFGGFRGSAYQLKADDFDQNWPQVTPAPWGYAVTWVEDSGPPDVAGDILFQRFDLAGVPLGPRINLTGDLIASNFGSNPSSLVWIGNEWLLVYFQSPEAQIWVRRFDASGQPIGHNLLIVDDTVDTIADPVLSWNGTAPLIAWDDARVGGVGQPRPVTSLLTCCEDVSAPIPVGGATWSDPTTLTWSSTGAPRYDRIRGDLDGLRDGAGNFTPTVLECRNDLTTTSSSELDAPLTDSAFYFVVRGDSACGAGSYNDPSGPPPASRDAGINASANACP